MNLRNITLNEKSKLQTMKIIKSCYTLQRASLVAQLLKNPPAMQETPVPFLGREDPLEKGMATHSSVLAWRILMDRRAWWATVHGVAKSDMIKQLSTPQHRTYIQNLKIDIFMTETT